MHLCPQTGQGHQEKKHNLLTDNQRGLLKEGHDHREENPNHQ